MIYSDEQIEIFENSFREEFSNGTILKKVSPNQEELYYKSIEQEDLEWVISANPKSKLFKVITKTN